MENKKVLLGRNAKAYNYILDIFKGECELNGYNYIKALGDMNLDEVLKEEKKVYYDRDSEFGFATLSKNGLFGPLEAINLAYKYIYMVGLENSWIEFKTAQNDYEKEITENLESIDIDCDIVDDIELKNGELLRFQIKTDKYNTPVLTGFVKKEGVDTLTCVSINYNMLIAVIDTDRQVETLPIDVCVISDTSFQSDAFIIGTSLKDAGYKAEIDYSDTTLKEKEKIVKELNPSYIVSITEKSMKNFEVELTDVKVGETHKIGINDLIEEIDMHF